MLGGGRSKSIDLGYINRINWLCCNSENLPIPTNYADVYITAFCLRNVTNLERSLKEAYRVLKPGGQFLCLEFSKVNQPILSYIYDLYSFNVIPFLGKIIAGDKESYQYLIESIREFPDQKHFGRLIENAGFVHVKHQDVNGGISAIHSAWRI